MRLEDPDGLAGGWLFAHLRVAPSPQTGNPTEFEPELLVNYAEACYREAATDVRAAASSHLSR